MSDSVFVCWMDCSCAVDLSTFAHLFVADSANTSYRWRLNGDDESDNYNVDSNDVHFYDKDNKDDNDDDDNLTHL